MHEYLFQVEIVNLMQLLKEIKRKNISFLINLIFVIRKKLKKLSMTINNMEFNAFLYQLKIIKT
jgi:hypothetical protein